MLIFLFGFLIFILVLVILVFIGQGNVSNSCFFLSSSFLHLFYFILFQILRLIK